MAHNNRSNARSATIYDKTILKLPLRHPNFVRSFVSLAPLSRSLLGKSLEIEDYLYSKLLQLN